MSTMYRVEFKNPDGKWETVFEREDSNEVIARLEKFREGNPDQEFRINDSDPRPSRNTYGWNSEYGNI